MLTPYLTSRYQDGGRGPDMFDCWGLVRSARHELFGLPLLPSYGDIAAGDKPQLTRAARDVIRTGFRPTAAVPGAIATCWRGQLCLHVGLVVALDGRPGVLDTGARCGPRWLPLRDFEQRNLKVIYYDDRDLSQHPAR